MHKIIFSLFALSLLGCSLVDSTITPEHRVVSSIEVEPAMKIHLSEVANKSRVDYAGVKKNEFGITTTRIYTRPAPPKLLRAALAAELRSCGCQVGDGPAKEVEIKADLLEYFVEPQISLLFAAFCAVIEAEFTVELPDGKRFRRRFKGVGHIYTFSWYTSLPVLSDSLYRVSLQIAMDDLMKKVIPAIGKLLVEKSRE